MVPSRAWLSAIGRYLVVLAVGNLAWEFAQMPLYTLWSTGSSREIVFAAVHCTGGDMLIGGAALAAALLLFGTNAWPSSRFTVVAIAAVAAGLAYTVYSEHLNTARNAWSYSAFMPVLPGLGVGLAPLAQWLIVPLLAFAASRRQAGSQQQTIAGGQGLDLPIMGITTSGATPEHLARRNRRAS
jgi:hypothetical protein